MESTNLATAYSSVLNFLSDMVSDSLLAIALSLVPIVLLQVSGHIDYIWLTEYTKALIARLQKILDGAAGHKPLVEESQGQKGDEREALENTDIKTLKGKYDSSTIENYQKVVAEILKDINADLITLRKIDDNVLKKEDKDTKQFLLQSYKVS